jgi:hypothetical protein
MWARITVSPILPLPRARHTTHILPPPLNVRRDSTPGGRQYRLPTQSSPVADWCRQCLSVHKRRLFSCKRTITKRESVFVRTAPDGSGAKRVAVLQWTSGDAGSSGGGLASRHSVTNLPTKVLVPRRPHPALPIFLHFDRRRFFAPVGACSLYRRLFVLQALVRPRGRLVTLADASGPPVSRRVPR